MTPEGLPELGRKATLLSGRNIPASVERIRRHNILVVGSFIMGPDSDRPGVGRLIAEAAGRYGVDNMNVLFLTPLPGTRLWGQLKVEGRIGMDAFPEDWKYYTLTYPVARYKYLSVDQIVQEMTECNSTFYSIANIVARMGHNLLAGRNPLLSMVGNLTSRQNSRMLAQVYRALWQAGRPTGELEWSRKPRPNLVDLWEAEAGRFRQPAAALRLQAAWLFRQP